MELSLQTRAVADHTVLEVGGEIDVYTAPRLRERLHELVDAGAHVMPVMTDSPLPERRTLLRASMPAWAPRSVRDFPMTTCST